MTFTTGDRDLLDVLRDYATIDGFVDLDALTADGFDVPTMTPALRTYPGLQFGFSGPDVDMIRLPLSARCGLPAPPVHPAV